MGNHHSFPATIKKVVLLGLPLMFGQLTHYFHQIADSAMLGHFGEESYELAAIGIAGLFTWILNTLMWPLSSGVQAIASRRYGRQDHTNEGHRHFTGEVLDNGIVTIFYAVVLATVLSFLARPLLSLLIETEEILELSLQYIRIVRYSLLPSGLYFVMQGFFGAINRTKYVMYSGILSNLVNIALNWVFIFGKFGLPAMGIRGAALGTALSFVVSFLFLLIIMIKRHYIREYRLFHFDRLLGRIQRDLVKVALPPCVQNMIALGIFMTYQTIIEDYSTVYLAATHSAFAFFRLNKTIIGGFARSASILAGNALGRQDKKEAHSLISASGLISAAVAILVTLAAFFGRYTIGGIFTSSPETSRAIAEGLLFFMPFYFVEALGYSFEMVFIANGYGRWVLFSEFSTNMIFILGATLLARYFFPGQIRLAWLCFGCYQATHASLMITGYFRKKWLHVEVDTTDSIA